VKKSIRLVLGLALLVTTSISANAATNVVRMTDKTSVEFGRFVEDIGRSDVIFIGDTHDDRELHEKQLEIIRGVQARAPRLAIGLEMFTADCQRYLDDWTNGKLQERDFAAIYARNWSYDWRLYRDIFIFARDNQIPMIALNVPKPIIAKVVRQGGKALTEEERKDLPPGGTWILNPRQAQYLRRIRGQVFGNRPSPIPTANFDEAQALRNQAMAYNIAKFRKEAPERKVVVIAGTWHAIKNGAPESLKGYGSSTYKVVLPDLPEFAWLKPTAEDVDYLITRGE
jgi:uncharacterized iron-regulated protein